MSRPKKYDTVEQKIEARKSRQKANYQANKEKIRKQQNEWYEKCGRFRYQQNRDRLNQNNLKYRQRLPEHVLLNATRARAKRNGIACDITPEDISVPKKCPVLDIPLKWNAGRGKKGGARNSPSLDRLIPALVYVKGNIRIISHRANVLKNNATKEELERVLEYIQSTEIKTYEKS